MTKKELKEYRHILAEEHQLLDELRVLKSRAERCTRELNAEPSGGGGGDPMPDIVCKMDELRTLLHANAMDLQARRIRIETAIAGLDSQERKLMRARYVEGKQWEQIAVDMNYSWQHLHKLHSVALQKMRYNAIF